MKEIGDYDVVVVGAGLAGLTPNTGFLKGVMYVDDAGHVPTDIWMRTELPGVFAVGSRAGTI